MAIEKIKSFFKMLANRMSDYRNYVPSYAPAALTFYIIILIVPAVSILALGASLLSFDASLIDQLPTRLMSKETNAILDVIKHPTISVTATFTTLFTLVLSIYAVSRGIGNIYQIAKEMFPCVRHDEEGVIGYYLYTFKITVFILLAEMGFMFVFAIGPIAKFFNRFIQLLHIRTILLLLIPILFFTLLYKIIPKARIRLKDAFIGGAFATVGSILLYFVCVFYFANTSFSNIYGPLASIVMVFFVLNWGCEIFYMGMYVTHLLYIAKENNK